MEKWKIQNRFSQTAEVLLKREVVRRWKRIGIKEPGVLNGEFATRKKTTRMGSNIFQTLGASSGIRYFGKKKILLRHI